MPQLYFVNSHTGNRYDVVSFDREAGEVTLRGPLTKGEFTTKFDKDAFLRMGYVLHQDA